MENNIRSYWSKIEIPRALYSTIEMLCLASSSAEARSPVCAATLSSPGDAGQYLHSQIHRLTPGICEERKITEQMKDARARNLRAVMIVITCHLVRNLAAISKLGAIREN